MNFQRLRYFEVVARRGSVRQAADELNITQPALSRQIKVLEEEVGVPLLIRAERRISLTPAGAYLWRKCGALLGEAAVLAKEVRRVSNEEPIPLTIGILQSLMSGIFPQAYMALRKEVGKVPLRVFGFRTSHIISGVLNGDYDLGIISEVIENPKLTVWPLFDDPHVTVLPKAHPLARRASVDIQSLADSIISWPRGFGIRDTLDRAVVSSPVRRYAAEVESLGAMLELVRAGLGTTVLPLSAVTPVPAGIVLRPLRGESVTRTVLAVHRVEARLPPFALRLLDLITQAALAAQSRRPIVERGRKPAVRRQ
jgi:LysR family hydrogen peroxide-inducible transcriptional activator